MHPAELPGRPCPVCQGVRQAPIVRLTGLQIIAGNWSYRQSNWSWHEAFLSHAFPIGRCADCGFVYAGTELPETFLDYVYDELIDCHAARREAFSITSLANRMSYLSILFRLISPPAKILDFGCGFGATLSLMANAAGIGSVGFETSPRRATELRAGGYAIEDNLAALRDHAPFSGLILDNVLEHLPNPWETVSFLRELCAQGGVIYVSVPDGHGLYSSSSAPIVKGGQPAPMELNPWEHLNYFTVEHLDRMMASAGFSPIRQAGLPSEVAIGLRPDRNVTRRLKNTLASVHRSLRYGLTGDALRNVNRRFYRAAGTAG